MATQAQIDANRENAKKAGVKTEGGKNKVRFNALKHGLTSKTIVRHLPFFKENLKDYENLLGGLEESLNPRNAFEGTLVTMMATAIFKMQRCDRMEADSLDEYSFEKEKLRIAHNGGFDLTMRYRTSIDNQFFRALEALSASRSSKQLDLFRNREVWNDD